MSRPPRARDALLLGAVEAPAAGAFAGTAWRVVREDRDPLACSAAGGRWDDKSFDVLYTSTKADGALAEMFFHLSRGQPVVPSKVTYRLYELRAAIAACVRISSLDALARLGLKTAGFGQLSYAERQQEYPRTQEIAEAAHFHGRQGLLVPSARSEHLNLIIFCTPAGAGAVEIAHEHGPIDWEAWRRKPPGY